MKPAEPIERLLEQTPVPSLSEGPHGDRLRNQLLEHSTTIYLRKTKMSLSNRISPALRTALAALVAILLIGSGWAAEKIYEQMTIRVEVSKPKEITLPDGTKAYSTVASVVDVNPNDPKSVEKADRTLKESLAAEEKRQDAMQKAIAAGRFRLIDVESNITHEYRDAGSDKTLQIMRLPNKDVGQIIGASSVNNSCEKNASRGGGAAAEGKNGKTAIVFDVVASGSSKAVTTTARRAKDGAMTVVVDGSGVAGATMPWKDHLRMIREGKRTLLHATVQPFYVYELTLDDGSKASYWCSFELKKPGAKY